MPIVPQGPIRDVEFRTPVDQRYNGDEMSRMMEALIESEQQVKGLSEFLNSLPDEPVDPHPDRTVEDIVRDTKQWSVWEKMFDGGWK